MTAVWFSRFGRRSSCETGKQVLAMEPLILFSYSYANHLFCIAMLHAVCCTGQKKIIVQSL